MSKRPKHLIDLRKKQSGQKNKRLTLAQERVKIVLPYTPTHVTEAEIKAAIQSLS